jgi:hypothetical protein
VLRTQCQLLRASDHRRQSDLQSDDVGGGSRRQQQLGAARELGSEVGAAWAPGSEVEGGAGCRAAAQGGTGIGGSDERRQEAELGQLQRGGSLGQKLHHSGISGQQ